VGNFEHENSGIVSPHGIANGGGNSVERNWL
jgi:hypothetical protein